MTVNEYVDNFIFCLKRNSLLKGRVTNIKIEDFSISFTIRNYYHYSMFFNEISDRYLEIHCHLHTRRNDMDACLFIADLNNEIVYKEWTDCEISESTPWHTSVVYEQLEGIQQLLFKSLQTIEELLDFYEGEIEEDTEELLDFYEDEFEEDTEEFN